MIRELVLILAIGLTHAQWARNRTEWKTWVKSHNNDTNSTWKAKMAPNITYEDENALRRMIGAGLSPNAMDAVVTAPKRNRLLQATNYPSSFDLRTKYPNCESITLIRNQYSCGACWAFSSMTSLSDRTCIKTYGQASAVQRSWSYQDALECCDQATCGAAPLQGCNGGYIDGAFKFAQTTGVVTGEASGDLGDCKPFFLSSFITASAPSCRSYCTNPLYPKAYTADRMRIIGYKAYSASTMDTPILINTVKDALMRRGTLVAYMDIYYDIYSYSSGVYVTNRQNKLGSHAVRMIGWGTDPVAGNYWLIANSWGPYWGEKGFFRIIMGSNNSGIETYIVEGVV